MIDRLYNIVLLDKYDGDLLQISAHLLGEDVVKITYNDPNFIFTVESFGQLPPREILGEAVNQFNAQLDELSKLITTIKN